MLKQDPQGWKPLSEMLRSTIRRAEERKIGLEVERIGLWPDGAPFLYQDKTYKDGTSRPGARTLLPTLEQRYGWELSRTAEGMPMGLSGDFGKISLEPGSQVELAAKPCHNLTRLVAYIDGFEESINAVTREWGLQWICIGVNPFHAVEAIDVIPSSRYHIMTEYLGARDTLGTSMMRLTSSVQINLDYTSEQDAIEMLRVALALAPLSYAVFANSPVMAKKPTGWLSYRQEIWRRTDPDRVGLLHEAFDPDFGFDAYARMAWDRPLMFVQKMDGTYVPARGKSLARIAAGELPGVEINPANLRNGLQELFFEARLKPGYVEVRSIDGQCPRERYAATAFWAGVMYSAEARSLALREFGALSVAEKEALFREAGLKGLAASHRGRTLLPVAKELAELARVALKGRNQQEEQFLEPVFQILVEEQNPAQRRLRGFYESWDGSAAELLRMAGQG